MANDERREWDGRILTDYVTKDSGVREEFPSGARRDTQQGKGRYDLMSTIALERIAGVLERGALKYGDRNWERGMPISRFMNSAIRHTMQYLGGARDEDHIAQAAWNLMAVMHIEVLVDLGLLPAELKDLPDRTTVTKGTIEHGK